MTISDPVALLAPLQDAPDPPAVDVPSVWRTEVAQKASTSTLTDEIEVYDASCQTIFRSDAAVQTATPGTTTDAVATDMSDALVTEALVDSLVNRLGPRMEQELQRQGEEGAAPGVSARDRTLSAEALLTLRALGQPGEQQEQLLAVTCLSWSCTGQTIAASFGRIEEGGWFQDHGFVATWNLMREQLMPEQPEERLAAESCLQSCAFHPQHPALLAGGSIFGELYVWDMSREADKQLSKSRITELSHREAIVQIAWRYSIDEAARSSNRARAYQLLTLGAEGRLLLWNWHQALHPALGFALGGPRRPLGGAAFSLPASGTGSGGGDQHAIVAAAETGSVYKGFVNVSDLQLGQWSEAVQGEGSSRWSWSSPLNTSWQFQPHCGPVAALHCSPFHPDVFLSAGTDGLVRVFSSRQRQALLEVEPSWTRPHTAQWSSSRPCVFAIGCGDGRVHFYDLSVNPLAPSLTLQCGESGRAVSGLAFNSAAPTMFATACGPDIRIWSLGIGLAHADSAEASMLERLAAADGSGSSAVLQALFS